MHSGFVTSLKSYIFGALLKTNTMRTGPLVIALLLFFCTGSFAQTTVGEQVVDHLKKENLNNRVAAAPESVFNIYPQC